MLSSSTPALKTLAAAAVFLSLSGCVNLDDAAGLSHLADQARLALPIVSNDVADTCIRQNTLFSNTPTKERATTEQAQDCGPYKEISRHLADDQNVLVAYFDALGQLSSNKPMAYDAAIDTNTTTVGSSTTLSADTIAAGSDAQNIVKSLADAATRGYREKQLADLIRANDPAIQSLTQALKKVITADYSQLLSNEELSLDDFYQAPMAAAQPTERLTLILVQRQYALDKAALDHRRANIVTYGKIMDDIAALHARLRQEAEKKTSPLQIAKELGPSVISLRNAIADLQTRSI